MYLPFTCFVIGIYTFYERERERERETDRERERERERETERERERARWIFSKAQTTNLKLINFSCLYYFIITVFCNITSEYFLLPLQIPLFIL